MSGAWKEKERLVAKWFDSTRNPLSGRNNVDDSGQRRLGDIIYKHAVVEVKRRKKNSCLLRAKETRKLATKNKKPWVHIEFSTGQPELVAFVFNYEVAEIIAKVLKSKWESGVISSGPEPCPGDSAKPSDTWIESDHRG